MLQTTGFAALTGCVQYELPPKGRNRGKPACLQGGLRVRKELSWI
jgi:hypothetical protein